jgi:hypothetical protein
MRHHDLQRQARIQRAAVDYAGETRAQVRGSMVAAKRKGATLTPTFPLKNQEWRQLIKLVFSQIGGKVKASRVPSSGLQVFW